MKKLSKGLRKKEPRSWNEFSHGDIVYNKKTGKIFSVNKTNYDFRGSNKVELCEPNSTQYSDHIESDDSNDYELFKKIDIEPEQQAVLNMINAKLERLESVISVKDLFPTDSWR